MNKVILIGRLTKDPELRQTQSGISMCRFTLAVTRSYQNKQDSNENNAQTADFISCIAWKNNAENLAKYMRKGSQIAIDGAIQTGSYVDQTGQKKYTTDVSCYQITFLGSKNGNDGNSTGGYQMNQTQQYNSPGYNQNNNQNYGANNYSQQRNSQAGYSNNNQNVPQGNNNQNKAFSDINNDMNVTDDDLPF